MLKNGCKVRHVNQASSKTDAGIACAAAKYKADEGVWEDKSVQEGESSECESQHGATVY
jgi:hypothetical protein